MYLIYWDVFCFILLFMLSESFKNQSDERSCLKYKWSTIMCWTYFANPHIDSLNHVSS